MSLVFSNRVELENAIKGKLGDAMDDLYDKLLNKLLSIIKKDVYGSYNPSFYERSYDLLNRENWTIERKKGTKYLTYKIYFKDECLSAPYGSFGYHDPHSYVHGNYKQVFDADNFLKMLNNQIQQGDNFGFPNINRTAFWDDFMNYCDKNIDKLFISSCKKVGLNIK